MATNHGSRRSRRVKQELVKRADRDLLRSETRSRYGESEEAGNDDEVHHAATGHRREMPYVGEFIGE